METSLTWLGRLAGGGVDADWRRLTDVYGPLLARWLAHLGVAPADRDDVVQEVMVVVVRRVAEFERRGAGAFRAWLRAILVNQARRHLRTRVAAPTGDLDAAADPHTEPDRQWDREHDEHIARRALQVVEGDFAPATWQAFRRQVIDGITPAAVATELELSLNAVILAKSRVLKRIREELCGLLE